MEIELRTIQKNCNWILLFSCRITRLDSESEKQ